MNTPGKGSSSTNLLLDNMPSRGVGWNGTTTNDLHVAVQQRDDKKVKKILKGKAAKAKQMLTTFDLDGQTPLSTALKNNDLDMVEQILAFFQQNKMDINIRDKTGNSVLHQAVLSPCCEDKVLIKLLQYDGIDVDVENGDKNRPLHYFCQNCTSLAYAESFQIFVDKGANVNAQNNNLETPLFKAIFNKVIRLPMVEILIKNNANVNIISSTGGSPLHYAIFLGRDDLLNVLLKAGADVNKAGGKQGKKPYELALEEGHTTMANRIKKHKDVLDWLKDLGLESYGQLFINKDLYLDVLADVDENLLEKIGITSAGHQIRIAKACRLLKESQPASEKEKKPVNVRDDDDPIPQPTPEDINQISALRDSLLAMKHSGPAPIINYSELEFTEKLGVGSSGKVYKGRYQGNEVAIKVLKSMSEKKEIEEFKKEFQIMSAIRVKFVVHFYGAALEPELCMIMELCAKGSLYHVLNSDIQIGWDKVFNFAIQATKGIECLHTWEPPIFHRDLKSLNLLVNDKWEVKVCDFGLSRFSTGSNLETLVKMRGTFAYCAPEVYFGEQFSTKSDVYSIGMILWELIVRCITGKYERPFAEFKNLQFDFQIIIQTAKKGLRPTIPPTCPAGFVSLIKDCMEHSTDKRPSCTEILTRLFELQQQWQENTEEWEKAKVKPVEG